MAIASSVATFTAPLTGHYQISSSIMTDGTEGASWANSMWYVNDAELSSSADLSYRTIEDPQGGAYQHHGISLLIALNANDTLNVKYRNAGDSTTNFRAWLSFHWVLGGINGISRRTTKQDTDEDNKPELQRHWFGDHVYTEPRREHRRGVGGLR